MKKRIHITAGEVSIEAELNDTPTAQKIWGALPITGIANRWGNEIYFEIPVHCDLEPDARMDVEVGDIGYWPEGDGFCIFFGPTPVSTGPKPRAYSPVNIIGKVLGDATICRKIKDGTPISITRLQE
jgi:hypothetical protein